MVSLPLFSASYQPAAMATAIGKASDRAQLCAISNADRRCCALPCVILHSNEDANTAHSSRAIQHSICGEAFQHATQPFVKGPLRYCFVL